MNSQKARIAVIGAGWWATDFHLPAILANPNAELVALCDPHAGRLEKAAQVYSPHATYADYHDMLAQEKLDGAIIVTPHATHFPIARDCLEAGLHLLIEKPLTLYARDARQLMDMAAARRLEVMVGYPYHYSPSGLRARQAVQNGELGNLQYVVCSYSTDVYEFLTGKVAPDHSPIHFRVHGPSDNYNRADMLGGGEGHLQLTHAAALMFFITGLRARRVQAVMSTQGLAVDLIDAMSVEFDNGAVGIVGGTGNGRGAYGLTLHSYGDAGSFIADMGVGQISLRKRDGSREDLSQLKHSGDSHYFTTNNFVNILLGQEANGSPIDVGVRTVELLDAAYRSAQQDGRPVLIEELYAD